MSRNSFTVDPDIINFISFKNSHKYSFYGKEITSKKTVRFSFREHKYGALSAQTERKKEMLEKFLKNKSHNLSNVGELDKYSQFKIFGDRGNLNFILL